MSLHQQYVHVREFTHQLVAELSPEDCMIQAMPDASPTRWHLAHTTWFFETFLLRSQADYIPFNESFNYLFNSYYNSVGAQFPRPERGWISRPGLQEILEYRGHVDQALAEYYHAGQLTKEQLAIMELGVHHEQQHQELILTDIKYALSANPLFPSFSSAPFAPSSPAKPEWVPSEETIVTVGHSGSGFAFDNELPRHRVLLPAHKIATEPVTCGEFLEFIKAGGYREPKHWLSLGWQKVCEANWQAPLYWLQRDGQWFHFTLSGLQPIHPDWPVTHISYFEADAFARWAERDCQPSLNGNMLQMSLRLRCPAIPSATRLCTRAIAFILRGQLEMDLNRSKVCLEGFGNGPAAAMLRIPVMHRLPALLVNTTASSCAINMC